MQAPPVTMVAFLAAMIGYPLLQIACLLASRPAMRRATALGERIEADAAHAWAAGAVDVALAGSHGLPGYLLLPFALPWRLACRLAGMPARGSTGGSDLGRLRDQVVAVSLMRWPLTSAATALASLPLVVLLCLVRGPSATRDAVAGEVVHLTGRLRLPRPAERAWIALAR